MNVSASDSKSQRASSSYEMAALKPLLGVVGSDAAQIGTSDAAAGWTDAHVQTASVVADAGSAASSARSDAVKAEKRNPNDGAAEYFIKHSSFRAHDKFFHCMLSYRVNSEGPFESKDKCGNDLARLVWQSCSHRNSSNPQNQEVEFNNEIATKTMLQSLEAIGKFGIWPNVFPNPTSPIRIFLDQKNLRPGVDWRGSGKLEDGGFLGALSSSLMIVPLLSATPVRFKIESTGEKDRYKFSSPANITIPGEKDSLELFRDSAAVAKDDAALMYTCKDFRSNGNDSSFILNLHSASGGNAVQTKTVENLSDVLFWTPKYFLPSDGSGPKGSVSEMLTIMQKSEALSFCVVEEPSPEFVVLEVVQLSDHVFSKNESILLHLEREGQPHDLKIDSVKVQGSIGGGVKSRLRVSCGKRARHLVANHTYEGKTVAADRKDNVLMELMLTRALHLVFADDTSPHPCKLILPVFVDDLDVLWAVSQRLSTEVSEATAIAVKDSLQKILQRNISEDEEKKWIRVSVKDAVQFIAGLQGLQLSVRDNRPKTMEAKAELVYSGIVSSIGIEAEMYSLEQYVADNPLAHELLDFINQEDIGHIGPALVKSDVTSLKIFSQLSSESIKLITQESREVSKRPLVREIADIESAVQAAKLSPYILPVSKRLATFEDKDASFMTIVYSTFAMEQALAKPFFGLLFMSIIAVVFSCVSVYQFLSGEMGTAIINLVRGLGFGLTWMCINVFNSIRSARKVLLFTFTLTALASIAAVVVVDKFVNGRIVWDYSRSCSQYLNSELKHRYGTCIAYQFSYNSWQAFLFLLVGAFVLWKQEWVWRLLCFGCSTLAFINLIFQILLQSEGPFDYFIVLSISAVLIVTEALKYYGTLQAIQLIQGTKTILSELWKSFCKDKELEHLLLLADCVQKECEQSPTVLDKSKKLGKWETPAQHTACLRPFTFRCGSSSVEPPEIHQETSDFDELYRRAACLNDTFQLWIESFFNEFTQPSGYVYKMPHHADEFKKNRLKGQTIRGPVKRPDRAIAKVCCFACHLLCDFNQRLVVILIIAVRFTAVIAVTSLC